MFRYQTRPVTAGVGSEALQATQRAALLLTAYSCLQLLKAAYSCAVNLSQLHNHLDNPRTLRRCKTKPTWILSSVSVCWHHEVSK